MTAGEQGAPAPTAGAAPHGLVHLAGSGPALHLAPANGFPPGAYREFATALADRCAVVALVPRPLWPGSRPSGATWHDLAQDLVDGLDAAGQRAIVGLGHSMGGVLTLWAARQRPDLFRAVVLVDPVLLPPAWLRSLEALRALGLAHRQPLVRAALQRRRVFASRQACFDHFRTKALFDRWSDGALWDYVDAATRRSPDGQLELCYPPEWEARLFEAVPTDVWNGLQEYRAPALVLRGEHSGTFLPGAMARLSRRLPNARTQTISGAGHLLPMERPGEVAAAVLSFLSEAGV